MSTILPYSQFVEGFPVVFEVLWWGLVMLAEHQAPSFVDQLKAWFPFHLRPTEIIF